MARHLLDERSVSFGIGKSGRPSPEGMSHECSEGRNSFRNMVQCRDSEAYYLLAPSLLLRYEHISSHNFS